MTTVIVTVIVTVMTPVTTPAVVAGLGLAAMADMAGRVVTAVSVVA
jgi:hypothetical protein